jgi:hypothetical protein
MVSTKGSVKLLEVMNKIIVKDELAMNWLKYIHALCAAGCGEFVIQCYSLCAGARYCVRKCRQKETLAEHKGLCIRWWQWWVQRQKLVLKSLSGGLLNDNGKDISRCSDT